MFKLKRTLRMVFLIAFYVFMAFAVGMTGAFLPMNRERFKDKEITIEQLDVKEKEDEDENEAKS